MEFKAAKAFILQKLQTDLSPELYYHSLQHTLDVVSHAVFIAEAEGVDELELILLKTAALYHDAGFLRTYKDHEEMGCQIAMEKLTEFNYTQKQINAVCGMIMATKIPQSPQNHLEEIICDADLFYLGTKDFYSIGGLLYKELLAHDIVQGEQGWNRLQVSFLENHTYFTHTAIKHCQEGKQRHLEEVKQIVSSYIA